MTVDYHQFINRNLPNLERSCTSKARFLTRLEARALMRRDNEPAESSVRANRLRTTAPELAALLSEKGVEARTDPLSPEAVVLRSPYDVHASPLFERGS